MRVNFRYRSSKSINEMFSDDPAWVQLLMNDFADAHDIDVDADDDDVLTWLYKPGTIKLIVKWMATEGYNCTYFELPYFPDDEDDDPEFMAYGMSIDDKCEKFVELRLRADKL